jgi:hypothetical protein
MISNNFQLHGFFSWQIINVDGSVASKSKEKNNLILNQGLEYPSIYYFADCFKYCCIGAGNQSPLLTDTGLFQEVKRTGNYYTGTNACRAYKDSDSFYIQRTFDFTSETQTVLYGEIGWSPIGTSGDNLFSKSIMVDSNGNPGMVQVNANQFMRVIYTLKITFSPINAVYIPNISGWTTDGVASAQLIGMYGVNSRGVTVFFDSGRETNEPKNNILDIFVSTGRQTVSGFGGSADYRVGASPQRATAYGYESGSLTKIYTASFGRASGTGNISTIGVGVSGNAPLYSTFVHRLNTAQNKGNSYELNLYFQYTWST